MTNLAQKLHPARFTAVSGKMAAIVGLILGETFTEPAIASIFVTSDNFILAMDEGDIGYSHFIGSAADLRRNWDALLDVAELTEEEHAEATRLFDLKL
jgi:hypothetical protein